MTLGIEGYSTVSRGQSTKVKGHKEHVVSGQSPIH